MLTQLHHTLWVHPVPYRVMGLPLGRQLVVVLLPDGLLWVTSPVPVTPELRAALDRLGRVGHVVAPNLVHDECLEEFQYEFPAAFFHGAPGLAKRKPRVHFLTTLAKVGLPAWRATIDQVEIEGMPRLRETVFFHYLSRTLILTDIAFNLGHDHSWFDRALFRLAGVPVRQFGPSRLCRSAMEDRYAIRDSFRKILQWDFDRIVVGHGRNIETGGKAAFLEAFRFLNLV